MFGLLRKGDLVSYIQEYSSNIYIFAIEKIFLVLEGGTGQMLGQG